VDEEQIFQFLEIVDAADVRQGDPQRIIEVPDRHHAGAHGADDVRAEGVADKGDLPAFQVQVAGGLFVDALVRLLDAEGLGDQHGVEESAQAEDVNLRILCGSRAVGDAAQLVALLQLGQDVMAAGRFDLKLVEVRIPVVYALLYIKIGQIVLADLLEHMRLGDRAELIPGHAALDDALKLDAGGIHVRKQVMAHVPVLEIRGFRTVGQRPVVIKQDTADHWGFFVPHSPQ